MPLNYCDNDVSFNFKKKSKGEKKKLLNYLVTIRQYTQTFRLSKL